LNQNTKLKMKKSTSTRRSVTPAKGEPASPAQSPAVKKDERKTKSVPKSKEKKEQSAPNVKDEAPVKAGLVKHESDLKVTG
jgi:hypothetical protein